MPPLLPTASFPDLRLAKQQVSQGRHLPCWEATGAIYHIALHLADSVPRLQLEIWQAERARLAEVAHAANRPLTQEERDALKAVYNDRVEKYLSAGHGACLLRDPQAAKALSSVLCKFNGEKYALHEWCIMPNHVHIVVGGFSLYCSCPQQGPNSAAPEDRRSTAWGSVAEDRDSTEETSTAPSPVLSPSSATERGSMRDVLSAWKRASAHLINNILGRSGEVWQRDSYTRIIRNREEYAHQMSYIWNNPESAGLSAGFLRERYTQG